LSAYELSVYELSVYGLSGYEPSVCEPSVYELSANVHIGMNLVSTWRFGSTFFIYST